MKYKVWAISLLYNDPAIIIKSIQQYKKTSDQNMVQTQHVFVWQHWPLGGKGELQFLAEELGAIWLDAGENLGLHRGFNYALDNIQIPDNAGVIGYDPDSWPVDYGWDRAMCEFFVSDPKSAWISLWHPHAERELITEGRGLVLKENPKVVQVKSPVMNSVCMFRKGWLRECGGIHEVNPYYGGLEVHTWNRLKDWKWLFLKDYREDYWPNPEMVNPLYREWKWVTTHGKEKQIEFGEWLKKRSAS